MRKKIKILAALGALLVVLIGALFVMAKGASKFGEGQLMAFVMFILAVALVIDLVAGAYYIKKPAIRIALIIIALIVAFFAIMLFIASTMVVCDPVHDPVHPTNGGNPPICDPVHQPNA